MARPVIEVLEDRTLLAVSLLEGSGATGNGTWERFAAASAAQEPSHGQVFFLDLRGASDVDYDGPVVAEIDVPAFSAPEMLTGQEGDIVDALLATLRDAFAGSEVVFTLHAPTEGEYSTVYIGGDGSEFVQWGRYYGLSEKVDTSNLDRSDKAFIFSENISALGLTAAQYGESLAGYVAHEAGHLLGLVHAYTVNAGEDPFADVAWKPYTHVEIGKDVLADITADGKLNIAGGVYDVHPKVLQALLAHPSYYNAGTVAPDSSPDLVMGLVLIHGTDTGTWLTRVFDMAWAAQTDSSFTDEEKSQILAWSYGFATHAAGDHWAHTLVNEFAEGVFPAVREVAFSATTEQRELANALRHTLIEFYIGDATKDFDGHRTEPDGEPHRKVLLDDDGNVVDVSDDSTPHIPFDAPIRFIYEALLRPFPFDPSPILEAKLEVEVGGVLDAATLTLLTVDAATKTFVRSGGDFVSDGFKVDHKITTSGFTNFANNGVFHVTAVTPTALTVAETLIDEAVSPASVNNKIQVFGVLTVDAAKNTFVRSTGNFKNDGFKEGHKITTSGFTNARNNGVFHVMAVTPTALTVTETLVDEAVNSATGDEKIQVFVPYTAQTIIDVDAANNSFVRTSGSFKDDGFVAGQRFTVYGLDNYHGDYLVASISLDGLTLTVKQDLDAGNETGSGDEQLVVQGPRGELLDKVFALRDTIETAAIDAGPRIELGTRVGDLLEDITQGTLPDQSTLDELYRAYLYNWVDEINEGLRHWGEVGLAFTKAMFDPQSRRNVQNEAAKTDGDDTPENELRANTEAGVGIIDVLLNELDDPNGDRSTADSFINKHLLPMFGLPEELGVLRAALQDFSTLVGDLLDPLQIKFNPIEAAIDVVQEFVTDFIKDEIEMAFGFSFEVFEFLTNLTNKMDLASITVTVDSEEVVVPMFKPGDHERIDALLGITQPADPDQPPHHLAFPNRLTSDVNAALAAAGLDGSLRAEAVGNKLRLVAIGPAVTAFKVTALAGNSLGFALSETAPTVDGELVVTAESDVAGNGRLASDGVFNVSINDGASVQVTVAATTTSTNDAVGNDIVIGDIIFSFYVDPKGALKDGVKFDKVTFATYDNSVTLAKMLLLMENPVDGETTGANQLSKLFSDVRAKLGLSPSAYEFAKLNLHGAHGGNILTTTLPGVPGTDGRGRPSPWLVSIDPDQVWRTDSATTTTALFRVSTNNDMPDRPAKWETAVSAGTYRVYATWQANVTQKTNNLDDAAHPAQHLLPATDATYTATAYIDDVQVDEFAAIRNQQIFADDIVHDGLGFELLDIIEFAAAGLLRIQLSNFANGHVVAGPILIERVSDGVKRRIQSDRDPETLGRIKPQEYSDNEAAWTDLVYKTGTGNYPLWESGALRPVFRELFVDWENFDRENNKLDFPALGDTPSPDPNLPSIVLFDTAESDLTDDDKFILDGFAEFLIANPLAHANVAGHTDRVGTPESNQTLSVARANSVSAYLQSKGVLNTLTVDGFGETLPAVPTADEIPEPANRRVELTVVVAPTPLPSHATPFGPCVPDYDVEIPIPQALEQLILDGLDRLVEFADSLDDLGPFTARLPVVNKSLGELLDLPGTLRTKVQHPVELYFANDATPTLHELFDALDGSGNGTPGPAGCGSPVQATSDGSGSPVQATSDTLAALLRFDLDLRAMVQDLAIELDPGLGLALEASATLDLAVAVQIAFGVDLSPDFGIPLLDRFFINAEPVFISADVAATDLNFGGQVGSVGVGIRDGSVELHAQAAVAFDDPNLDGKITLAELRDTPLTTLVSVAPSVSVDANLPVFADPFNLGGVTVALSGLVSGTQEAIDFFLTAEVQGTIVSGLVIEPLPNGDPSAVTFTKGEGLEIHARARILGVAANLNGEFASEGDFSFSVDTDDFDIGGATVRASGSIFRTDDLIGWNLTGSVANWKPVPFLTVERLDVTIDPTMIGFETTTTIAGIAGIHLMGDFQFADKSYAITAGAEANWEPINGVRLSHVIFAITNRNPDAATRVTARADLDLFDTHFIVSANVTGDGDFWIAAQPTGAFQPIPGLTIDDALIVANTYELVLDVGTVPVTEVTDPPAQLAGSQRLIPVGVNLVAAATLPENIPAVGGSEVQIAGHVGTSLAELSIEAKLVLAHPPEIAGLFAFDAVGLRITGAPSLAVFGQGRVLHDRIPSLEQDVGVEAALTLDLVNTTLSGSLSLLQPADGSPPIPNLFGIDGLNILEGDGEFGINFATTPLPLPTIGFNLVAEMPDFAVNTLSLPRTIGAALNISTTEPIFAVSVLDWRPFHVLGIDNIVIDEGSIVAAPNGGSIATKVFPRGFSASFEADILGTHVSYLGVFSELTQGIIMKGSASATRLAGIAVGGPGCDGITEDGVDNGTPENPDPDADNGPCFVATYTATNPLANSLTVDFTIDLPGPGGLLDVHGELGNTFLVLDATVNDWRPITGLDFDGSLHAEVALTTVSLDLDFDLDATILGAVTHFEGMLSASPSGFAIFATATIDTTLVDFAATIDIGVNSPFSIGLAADFPLPGSRPADVFLAGEVGANGARLHATVDNWGLVPGLSFDGSLDIEANLQTSNLVVTVDVSTHLLGSRLDLEGTIVVGGGDLDLDLTGSIQFGGAQFGGVRLDLDVELMTDPFRLHFHGDLELFSGFHVDVTAGVTASGGGFVFKADASADIPLPNLTVGPLNVDIQAELTGSLSFGSSPADFSFGLGVDGRACVSVKDLGTACTGNVSASLSFDGADIVFPKWRPHVHKTGGIPTSVHWHRLQKSAPDTSEPRVTVTAACNASRICGTITVTGTSAPETVRAFRSGSDTIVQAQNTAGTWVNLLQRRTNKVTAIEIDMKGGNDSVDLNLSLHTPLIDINPFALPAVLRGGTGRDVIRGGSGANTIYGGTGGSDGPGRGFIFPGFGAAEDVGDQLFGGSANDSIFGEGGNDSITGGGGTDVLDGGPGTNIINGTLVVRGTDRPDGLVVSRELRPGVGLCGVLHSPPCEYDLVVQSGIGPAPLVTLIRTPIEGLSGIDVDAMGRDDRIVIGSNVTLPAILSGGAGNDFIQAGGGATTVRGGPGDDQLASGPATDSVFGEDDNDVLLGSPGDLLDGGAGSNLIILDGKLTIRGMDEAEQLEIARMNDELIVEFARTTGLTVDIFRVPIALVNSLDVDMSGGDDAVEIAADVLLPAVLGGGPHNDRLQPGGGPSTVQGGDGDDEIIGGPANDLLLGGPGDDVITCGGGIDTPDGGTGNDLVTCGDNHAPTLDPIADHVVDEGSPLTFTVTATDLDNNLPADPPDDPPIPTFIGPIAYLSQDDSPFGGSDGGADFAYFHLEDFEDGALNVPGVTASAGAVFGPSEPAQIPPGLVSWYRAEGNADDSADGNHGMLQNGADFAAGQVGQAFRFDGVDDQVLIPHDANQNAGSQFTIEAWVNPSSSGHGRPIAQKRSPGNVGGYTFETTHAPFAPNDGLQFIAWIGGGQHFLQTPANVLTNNTWQHVAATYNGMALRIYVNGVEQASTSVSGTIDAVTDPFVIGRNVVIPSFAWQGFIDELGIYNRVLSASEIGVIFNAGTASGGEQTTYSVGADFSRTTNPGGPWSYGWTPTRGGEFHLYPHHFTGCCGGLDVWDDPAIVALGAPGAVYNGTGAVQFPLGIPLAAGAVIFHPGQLGENGVFRWTAPVSGQVEIDATFTGFDGATTDVAVLHGVMGQEPNELFSGDINGRGDTEFYTTTIDVMAGQTIDFTVGHGGNGFFFDSTTLDATITLTPGGHTPETFSAADDFSATQNPTGPWSYGTIPVADPTVFSLFDQPVTGESIDGWHAPGVFSKFRDPSVLHNGTDTTQRPFSFGECLEMASGQLALHPGSAGRQSVARFTAPAVGDYSIDAIFQAIDCLGETTVSVRRGQTSLFADTVGGDAPANAAVALPSISLAAGETIDFIAAYARISPVTGISGGDSVALDATVAQLMANGNGGGGGPGGTNTPDSVDADDATIDGDGSAGHSFTHDSAVDGITFAFDAETLGGLPTHVGIVWTDGGELADVTFAAFDAAGSSLGIVQAEALGDATNDGTTAEDRFFGIVYAAGISAITIRDSGGSFIEVDHLQFGRAHDEPPPPPPITQTLTFSLDPGAPAGAMIDPETGVFTWTPTEIQGPRQHSITVRVTDDGTPSLSDSQTITVTVNEVNEPPVLANITNRRVRQGETLNFAAQATDPDRPANRLDFSLDPGAPTGAAIDERSGEFTWTPSADIQPTGDYEITVRVTDRGSPALGVSQTITITVEADVTPPTIDRVKLNSNDRIITEIIVFASESLDPDRAADVANYRLISPGDDRELGTADDVSAAPASAVYDAAAGTVRLTPAGGLSKLNLNRLFGIIVSSPSSLAATGLTDLAENPLDGDRNGTAGGDYVASAGRSNDRIAYRDSTRDTVALTITRGIIDLLLGADGEAVHLSLHDGPGATTMTSRVRTRKNDPGTTTLKLVTGTEGIQVSLPPSTFQIGQLSGAAVDDLLASGDLSELTGP